VVEKKGGERREPTKRVRRYQRRFRRGRGKKGGELELSSGGRLKKKNSGGGRTERGAAKGGSAKGRAWIYEGKIGWSQHGKTSRGRIIQRKNF